MCRACRRVVLHGLLSRHILRLHRSRPTQCCPARRVALAPRAYVWVLSLSRRHVGEAVKLRWSSCQCATHRDGPGLPERCLPCPDIFNADIKVVFFDNVVKPLTFNEDKNEDELATIKIVKFVLFNEVVDVAFKLFIEYVEFVLNEFAFVNNVVDVAFKLFFYNVEFFTS